MWWLIGIIGIIGIIGVLLFSISIYSLIVAGAKDEERMEKYRNLIADQKNGEI